MLGDGDADFLNAIDWVEGKSGIELTFFAVHGKDGRLLGFKLLMDLFSNFEEKAIQVFDRVNFVDQTRFVTLDATSTLLGQRQFFCGSRCFFTLLHQRMPLFSL